MTFPEAILPVIAIFKTDGIITILNRETLFFLAGMIIFTLEHGKTSCLGLHYGHMVLARKF